VIFVDLRVFVMTVTSARRCAPSRTIGGRRSVCGQSPAWRRRYDNAEGPQAGTMEQNEAVDYYETLQISANADPDTIHRVYRMLAQRFHPDNKETGSASRFRLVSEAFEILSVPEKRARYDVAHQQRQRDRWRLVAKGAESENDFVTEQVLRLTVLEVLYTKRRVDMQVPGIFSVELEQLTGRPREHLEFTLWYLVQRKLVTRGDSSLLQITADGVDYLEQNYQEDVQRRRLRGKTA
jgi:curved DNA-binding protein CbpA